jgi:tocopherol O-methyltransferase
MNAQVERPASLETGAFYDELDRFFREIWGEHVHHGLWESGTETPEEAVLKLVEQVAALADIHPGDAVCDVGAGYGGTSRLLAERYGARVTALTVSPAQHRFALAANGGAENPVFLLRDWYENALPDSAFQAAVAVESFAHMPDKTRALAEAYRVLESGGRLVLCLWLAGERPSRWQRRHLLDAIVREGRLGGLLPESEYRRLLAEAGFELDVFRDASRAVARTWTICIRRTLAGLWRKPSYRQYLRDAANRNRGFFLSLFRMRLAFATGAMRYGIVAAHRP